MNNILKITGAILILIAIFLGGSFLNILDGNVALAADAPTCSMNAIPANIMQGQASTITWSSNNATSVYIQNLGTDIGTVGPAGSRTVRPTTTTLYRGTFTGPGGTIVCSRIVNVTYPVTPPDAPTCSMSAIPSNIYQGGSATISWSSNNATSASISNIGTVATAGSRNVSPNSTTTYTGTFTGAGGSVTCSRTITVTPASNPAPTCSLTASPSSIHAGDSSTLSWTATNATLGYIENLGADVGNVNSVEGSTIVNPTTTSLYTGTFTGPGGSVTCTAMVNIITICPMTCSLGAIPSTIYIGESATLNWDSDGAETGTIDNGIGIVDVSGSVTVSPTQTTTYTGTFGSYQICCSETATCSTTVTVQGTPPPAPTCSMNADPTTIDQGGSSTLTWTTTNVASVSVDNGVLSTNVNDSEGVFPNTSITYTGTFVGTNGDTIYCDATVTVEGTPPPSPTCTMNFNPTAVRTGGSSTLTWTSTNTTSADIDNGVGTVDPNDSMSITPPDAMTYTGIFTGPYGSVTCSASISVSSVCLVNCGGGNNPPNVSLMSKLFPGDDPDPSYIYLSQVPYTGFLGKILNGVKFIMVTVPTFIMVNI